MLSYYKDKPYVKDIFYPHETKSDFTPSYTEEDEFKQATTTTHFFAGAKAMVLNDESTIEEGTNFMQPTLKVITPSTSQSIILRMKHGGDKEKKWKTTLEKTIQLQALSKLLHQF